MILTEETLGKIISYLSKDRGSDPSNDHVANDDWSYGELLSI